MNLPKNDLTKKITKENNAVFFLWKNWIVVIQHKSR